MLDLLLDLVLVIRVLLVVLVGDVVVVPGPLGIAISDVGGRRLARRVGSWGLASELMSCP